MPSPLSSGRVSPATNSDGSDRAPKGKQSKQKRRRRSSRGERGEGKQADGGADGGGGREGESKNAFDDYRRGVEDGGGAGGEGGGDGDDLRNVARLELEKVASGDGDAGGVVVGGGDRGSGGDDEQRKPEGTHGHGRGRDRQRSSSRDVRKEPSKGHGKDEKRRRRSRSRGSTRGDRTDRTNRTESSKGPDTRALMQLFASLSEKVSNMQNSEEPKGVSPVIAGNHELARLGSDETAGFGGDIGGGATDTYAESEPMTDRIDRRVDSPPDLTTIDSTVGGSRRPSGLQRHSTAHDFQGGVGQGGPRHEFEGGASQGGPGHEFQGGAGQGGPGHDFQGGTTMGGGEWHDHHGNTVPFRSNNHSVHDYQGQSERTRGYAPSLSPVPPSPLELKVENNQTQLDEQSNELLQLKKRLEEADESKRQMQLRLEEKISREKERYMAHQDSIAQQDYRSRSILEEYKRNKETLVASVNLEKAIDERRQSLLETEREEGIASWCSVVGRQVEPVDVRIPVKQVIMVKCVEEDSDGNIHMKATFVTTIYGVIPVDDEGTYHMFKYRFNDSHATDEQLQFRRTRTDVITHADGSEQPCATSTYSAIVPLERTEVLSEYPFMIFKLRVLIEMSTFEHNNIQFRPNLVFTEDVLEHGRVWRNFLVRDPHPSVFDKCRTYDFVATHPTWEILHDAKDDYCPKILATFYVKEPLMKKMVTVVLPVVLVVFQNILNSFANQEVGDYIANSSAISLTLIFLLPSMYPITTYKVGWMNTNDIAVILIFVACLTALMRTFHSEGEPGTTISFNTGINFDGDLRGNWWYWFCDTGVPCIVTVVSMLYFIVFPYNFYKRESIIRQIRDENGLINGRRDVNIDPDVYDKHIDVNGGKENRPNEKRRMETSDNNTSVEPVKAFVVKTEPGRKTSKRGEGHKSYKEQYTTYGWLCGYVHFDGSVAKRKSALGHWHHKVEVTSQGRRVLVPQTSLTLRPGGASPAHQPSLPAEINNQFLEDHHYTTPR